ncbi:hypothetical protein HGRIS_011576 [Hohenbuehelia grisea]|uniref:Uncharacterized protein n=1 Tax=Hohenbuehelia grisea TaxID=104357 RepID=A0ABR3JVP7_9AGAR
MASSSNPPFVLHQPKHQHPEEPTHSPLSRIPIIPDLRFEYSYLRSIRPFVKFTRTPANSASLSPKPLAESGYEIVSEKGKEKESPTSSPTTPEVAVQPTETIQIQWGKVLWVTTRDQIVAPFLQGALWGVAGYFLVPLMARARKGVASFFVSRLPKLRPGEGKGAASLRGWARGLNASAPPSIKIKDA